MRFLMHGFAALALAGFVLGGLAQAEEKKDKKDDKKEKKSDKPAVPDLADFDKLLQGLGGNLNDEQRKDLMERFKKMREMLEQMQKGGGLPGGLPGGGGLGGGLQLFPAIPLAPNARRATSAQETRLGAKLGEPSATLIDQLDLPKGQGMVLEEVGPNSPAAKVGLKANDILLEIDGKPVSTKKGEFDKTLADVKADKAVDVVVMRKGKKETLKGLTLPEAKPEAKPQPRLQPLPKLLPNLPRLPGGLGGKLGNTTVIRNNDEFTTKHSADGVTYTVKGTVNQGKAEASEITVDDGKANTYASLDKVPAEHQETVKKLIEMSGGRGLRLRFNRQ